jgi:tetratricopeptide (TPR) repeat protein
MTHIPEGELALYAMEPAHIESDRRAEIETHLASCGSCQTTHDFFVVRTSEADETLSEADTWEPSIGSATYRALMDYGARVAEEDRQAEVLLKPYLEKPIKAAWDALAEKRRFRTGGVVRKFCTAAHDIHRTKPRVALTFADVAISIAEVLPDDLYPAAAVYQLRGTAWKERANAQMFLGELPQAHDSLDHAERAYRRTPHNGLGLAAVALLRAGVLYAQLRHDEAIVLAERAERGFSHAGDERRSTEAAFLRGSILFEVGDISRALSIFRCIVEQGENTNDVQLIARGSYAAGNCEVEQGNLGEASLLFHRALLIFREHGPDIDKLMTEWGIARVLFHGGKLAQAVHRFRELAGELEQRGMVAYAADVGLDISEGLLALDQMREIVPLAQHLFSTYTKAGILTGALSALAYLKEAAAAKRLTRRDVDAVRTFLRRVERQPTLKFAPPPRHPEDST